MKPSRLPNPFILLASLLLALPAHADPGSWSTRGPHGGSVSGLTVYEPGPTTFWAIGRGGVFRSVSSGNSWSRIQVGLPSALYPSVLVASTTAPVVYLTDSTRIYRSANAGSLWIPTALPTVVGPDAFFTDLSVRRGTTNSIAVTAFNAAYVSTNGGSSWTAPGATGTSADFTQIEFAADGSLYLGIRFSDPAAFGGAVVLKSIDAGATWLPTASQPAIGGVKKMVASPVNPQRIYASGTGVATSSDGGATWSPINLPASGCGPSILEIAPHPTLPNALFVGCAYQGVSYAPDVTIAAPAWTTAGVAAGFTSNGSDPAQAASFAIHPSFASTPTLLVGAPDGGIFKSANGGTTFAPSNNGYESTNIRALAPHPLDTGEGTVVLAGYGDVFTTTSTPMYRSPDNALTWASSAGGMNAESIRAVTIDPTTVDLDPFTAENFTAYAAGVSGQISLLANRDGGIYKSTNGGNNWTTIDNGIAVSGGTRYMGTVRNVVLDSRSCAAPPPSGPCAIGSGPLQTVYVAGSGVRSSAGSPYASARIYKSNNAGATWTASENGLPLPQDLGPPGMFNIASTGALVPLVIDPANPQTLYVGSVLSWNADVMGAALPTLGNGVFKSTDGGATWSLSSTGLPTVAGPGTSNWDVLALAINPVNPLVLYAGAANFAVHPISGRVFKSVNGGATWSESSVGIAGADIRALLIDPGDPTGATIYAGTGGSSAGPGGVFRSRDSGATWNSISLNLPATAALALSLPSRGFGAPARLLAGTTAGMWEYTEVPDEDADGARTSIENLIGDGNGDSIPDAMQPEVASVQALPSTGVGDSPSGGPTSVKLTMTIVNGPGACVQFNDATNRQASLYPPDPIGTATSLNPNGLISFAMPNCPAATVRVKYNYVFDSTWHWRNYGPRIPGVDTSFGWYSFGGARRISADTWELDIDASRQGNYRSDANNILFVGGPSRLPDLIFDHGFE